MPAAGNGWAPAILTHFSLSYKPVSVKGFEASVTLDNAFNKLAMNGKGVPLSGRTVSLYTRYQW